MVKLKNYAREAAPRQGSRWFKWKVFVDGTPDEISSIEEVEYTLRPTFPEPIQKCKNERDKFSYQSSGWGEFTIRAEIRFKDGHTETLTHWLDSKANWPS